MADLDLPQYPIPTSMSVKMKRSRFATFAWATILYNLAVILWGAYVRASGSGAGCGSHWPLCNGEVIPRAPQFETLVELTHRATSGIALLMVVGLAVWAFRAFPRGHQVRLGAGYSLFFILTEALVGAGLVLFELVADNASIARALFMAVHLANTFLLLAALTITAWWASGGDRVQLRGQGIVGFMLLFGIVGTLLLGVSGAVTALGDTLFPAGSLAEGLRQDFSPTAHVLLRLRIFHPPIAVGMGLYLIATAAIVSGLRPNPATKRFAQTLAVLFVLQLGLGVLNVFLLAPIPMQLAHLLLADIVWIVLVLLAATALSEEGAMQPVELAQPATQIGP